MAIYAFRTTTEVPNHLLLISHRGDGFRIRRSWLESMFETCFRITATVASLSLAWWCKAIVLIV